jgi:hypothetical protein
MADIRYSAVSLPFPSIQEIYNMKAKNIFIGCGIALLLCIVVSGVAFVVLGNAAVKVVNSVVAGPYEIGKRPLPADATQDTLLPATVGAYTRGTVTAAGPAFSAVYTNGTNTVTAVATAYDSANTAEAAVTAAATADSSLTFKVTGLDPSYATDNASQGSATKIFYSRGVYGFTFVGSSASSLDGFMTKFPY